MIRKGSRALQQLPASPDAFVWLRLYQQQMRGLVPAGPDDPLWWTLRRPFRPLTYHAAPGCSPGPMLLLGANWSLHDLRHTAAYRMARDPEMPITDVQWVLGHAHLSTTQIYVTPRRKTWCQRAGPPRAARPARKRPGRQPPPGTGPRRWTSCSGRARDRAGR